MRNDEFEVFNSEFFRPYAVRYNIVYQYLDLIEQAFVDEEKMIIVLFPIQKPFLIWTDENLDLKKKERYLLDLLKIVEHHKIKVKEVHGKKGDLEIFFRLYEKKYSLSYKFDEELVSYSALQLIIPPKKGKLIKASNKHCMVLAEFINKFEQDALHYSQPMEKSIARSQSFIKIGNAYLWEDNENITAMGVIWEQSKHIGRINYIYVDNRFRKKGYAKMLVASLGEILQSQNRLPVLYAAKNYTHSNKVYKSVGFEEGGELHLAYALDVEGVEI